MLEKVFSSHILNKMNKNLTYEEIKKINKIDYITELTFKLVLDSVDFIHKTISKPRIINNETIPNGCCIPGSTNLLVSCTGNYYFCEKMSYHGTLIGNVEKGIILDNVKEIISNYEKTSLELCNNCWAINICRQCFIHAHDGENFSKNVKKEKCEKFKKEISSRLLRYCTVMEKDQTLFNYNLINN